LVDRGPQFGTGTGHRIGAPIARAATNVADVDWCRRNLDRFATIGDWASIAWQWFMVLIVSEYACCERA
jgi:hypothetical protein